MRLKELVGNKRGAQKHYVEKWRVKQSTLNLYLSGKRFPSYEFLSKVAQIEGVSFFWLLSGEEPKYPPKDVERKGKRSARPPQLRRIPILAKVPAGSPGGWRYNGYDADDLLEDLTGITDPHAIGLKVHGDSMFPTLFDGDKVIMTSDSTWGAGDLVVAEIRGSGAEYQIKRLGQVTRKETVLISDNFLYYPPETYPADQMNIRGKVIRVIRTPSRRSPDRYGSMALAELYRNPQIQEIIERLPELGERDREMVIGMIEMMWKSRGKAQ